MAHDVDVDLSILRKIAREGRESFIRAIGNGRLTAMVGSGLPASYGRPTWAQLIEAMRDVALRAEDAPSVPASHRDGLPTRSTKEAKELLKTIGGSQGEDLPDLDAWKKMLVAQLCAEIDAKGATRTIKDMTASTRPYAQNARELILGRAAIALEQEQEQKAVKDQKPIPMPDPESTLDEVAFILSKEGLTEHLPQPIQEWSKTPKDDRGRCPLSFVGLIDAMIGAKLLSMLGLIDIAPRRWQLRWLADLEPFCAPSEQSDPAWWLIRQLGVRRFLTTNYDVELEKRIERYCSYPTGSLSIYPDKKAPKGTASSSVEELGREDPTIEAAHVIEGRAGSVVLTRETVADLAEFGSTLSKFDRGVFHLHGRCLERDSVVASEEDYQNLYIQDHEDRLHFREAIEIAFGANPILFVGFGMQEADVMRPLRQFVSNERHDRDRTLVALMPFKKDAKEEAAETEGLRVQFGAKVEWPAVNHHNPIREYGRRIRSAINSLRNLASQKSVSSFFVTKLRDDLNVVNEYILSENPRQENFINIQIKISILIVLFQYRHMAYQNMSPSAFNTNSSDQQIVLLSHITASLVRDLQVLLVCRTLQFWANEHQSYWKAWWTPARARSPWIRCEPGHPVPIFYRHCVLSDPRAGALATSIGAAYLETVIDGLSSMPWSDRRVVVAHSAKGGGRGALMGALRCNAPRMAERLGYSAVVLISTAFSYEFASVMDFLAYHFFPSDWKPPATEPGAHLTAPRLAEFRRALRLLKGGPRKLIVIHEFSTLLDERGKPHGGEYSTHLPFLLGPEAASLPLDIVLTTNDSVGAHEFIKSCAGGSSFARIALEPPWGAGKAKSNFTDFIEGHDIEGTIHCAGLARLWDLLHGNLYSFSVLEGFIRNHLLDSNEKDAINPRITSILTLLRQTGRHDRVSLLLEYCLGEGLRVEAASQPESQREQYREHMLNALKHLAIFSTAVRAGVLAACPAFAEKSVSTNAIEQMLERLVDRDLVFKIYPSPTFPRACRYALHREMQRVLLRRMGGDVVETGETNYFQVGLYAAQPIHVPMLGPTSYDEVTKLVDGLIRVANDSLGEPGKNAGDLEDTGGILRAAFAASRSCLSLAGISRFNGSGDRHKTADAGSPRRLSMHGERLRDLLNAVREHSWNKPADAPAEPGHPPALYRDEIVWLKNERGLVALAQGRLLEAGPLLRAAMDEVRRIEGSDRESPTRIRIRLNLAMLDIERGRIPKAITDLESIIGIEAQHTGVIWQGVLPPLDRRTSRCACRMSDHRIGRGTWLSGIGGASGRAAERGRRASRHRRRGAGPDGAIPQRGDLCPSPHLDAAQPGQDGGGAPDDHPSHRRGGGGRAARHHPPGPRHRGGGRDSNRGTDQSGSAESRHGRDLCRQHGHPQAEV